MRHATVHDLEAIEALLAQLRSVAGMVERGPGRFYSRGAAFLHFHEDRGALLADVKESGEWVRYPVATARDRTKLLTAARKALAR